MGELWEGQGFALHSGSGGRGEATPLPVPFKSVICTPYSEICIHLYTFAQAAGRFALLHGLSPGPRFPFSLGQPCCPYLFRTHPINLLNQRVGWAADPRRSRRRTRISWRPNSVA